MNPSLLVRLCALFLAAWALLSCGGGVGTGGTGSFRPIVVSGPIEGFGSVIVGGIEFDDTGAAVYDDAGNRVVRDGGELRLGMTVSVEGTAADTGEGARAQAIRLSSLAIGSVAAVDMAAGRIEVLGQTVQVNAATVFDPSLASGLGSLKAGDTIAVYGLPGPAAQGAVATRVERAAEGTPGRVQGVVHSLDTAARTFRIGQAVFSYTGAAPPDDIANGRLAKVRVDSDAAPGQQVVEDVDPPEPTAPEGGRSDIEGTVASVSGDATFVVDGQRVDASGADITPAGTVVTVGAQVRVSGTIRNGVLEAETVKVARPDEASGRIYRVNGTVESLDLQAGTFVVRKTVVDYRDAQFVGGTAGHLRTGVKVRTEGPLSPDGTRVRATRIEFR